MAHRCHRSVRTLESGQTFPVIDGSPGRHFLGRSKLVYVSTETTEPIATEALDAKSLTVDLDAEEVAQKTFSTSIAISAVRCLLTYVLFPFVAPIVGIASGVGSTVGVVTSIVGIAANVWSIRRFHASQHPWRWPITAINVGVIVLLAVLFVIDLTALI